MRKTALFFSVLLLAGCAASPPPDVFAPKPEHLLQRQAETRRYEGMSGEDVFIAGANVIQDLGFSIEKSESDLWILTASKHRDATDGGEFALSVVSAILTGVATPMGKDQIIRVSLVVRPALDSTGKEIADKNYVRVNFQRIVRYTNGLERAETLTDTEIHKEFHDKLSKSIFLTAQDI